jgi:predicted PurR-regulated permease PerM
MATIIEYFAFPLIVLLGILVLAYTGVLHPVATGVCLALMVLYVANVWHKILNDGRELFERR